MTNRELLFPKQKVELLFFRSFLIMKKFAIFFAALLVLSSGAAEKKKNTLPAGVKAIDYPCTVDNSMQKAMCFIAQGKQPRPLLVALHTWGGSYRQNCRNYALFCVQNNWNFIFPDFRGPNRRPDACGSEKVVADIVDAVAYMKKAGKVDPARVYLIGGSGGGHATLLLAGRHPELWTAVSAWCPISDIAAWYKERSTGTKNRGYAAHILKVCGGNPLKDPQAKAEAVKRSPLTWLARASQVKVDISTGIHDGHTGSVPVSHALNAYNVLADKKDRISREDIDFMTREQKIPEKFGKPEKDPSFGNRQVLFRRHSNRVRITLFKGGHDILPAVSAEWLERQVSGEAPDWKPGKEINSTAAELSR